MKDNGLLLCARYAVAPNYFGYCGPDENKSLLEHLQENKTDREVNHILSGFETLYPYLQLIAKENNITSPFDAQVVEAYWLGNSLLKKIKNKAYVDLLSEKLMIEKKAGKRKYMTLREKLTRHHFSPHHTFHVFNIFKRTGHDASEHTIKTMNECRISHGEILQVKSEKLKVKNRQIKIINNRLTWGDVITKGILVDYKGIRFMKDLKVGDYVSFHWGFVCDVLTKEQVYNLSFFTQKAIEYYNTI